MKSRNIAVIAPSSRTTPEALAESLKWMKRYGHNVNIDQQVYDDTMPGPEAGSALTRVAALHNALSDQNYDTIMCASGGNRALQLLDKIDYELFKKQNKPFIGFSDATCLLNAVALKSDIVTYHGPCLTHFDGRVSNKDLYQLFATLDGDVSEIEIGGKLIKDGFGSRGKLIGGNLSSFQTLLGCGIIKLNKDFKYLLFLEDTGDDLSRYDRMFLHLKQTGFFEYCSGLILGKFDHNEKVSERVPFNLSIDELVLEHVRRYNFPVISGADFGHGHRITTYPIGRQMSIDISDMTLRDISSL